MKGTGGRALALIALLILTSGITVSGQERPVMDGTVTAGEYQLEHLDGPVRLSASFDADRIYLAVTGETAGWVAIGLASQRMDGADIAIGYVANGRESFTTQRGMGHSHRQAAADAVLAHALAERDGATTMELTLDRSVYLTGSQQELDIIYAVGSADTFTLYHRFKGRTRLTIQ